METPYSKQDEAIDLGAQALRDQAIDTSRITSVLNPAPRRSVVLPVGLATAAACVLGAVVLLTPTKADAGEFDKVRKAVQGQTAVFERVMVKQVKKGDTWKVASESWKNGKKKGVKLQKAEGTYEVVLDGNKVYEKNPKDTVFFTVDLVDKSLTKSDVVEVRGVELIDVEYVAAGLILAEHEPQTINEILARDGMDFRGVRRAQMKEGRKCDIYRVKMGESENETLYYVDFKTDLPFLKEEIDESGKVLRRIEILFPGEIDISIKLSDGRDVLEVAPVVKKIKGSIKLDEVKFQEVIRTRIVEGASLELKKSEPPKTSEPPAPAETPTPTGSK